MLSVTQFEEQSKIWNLASQNLDILKSIFFIISLDSGLNEVLDFKELLLKLPWLSLRTSLFLA